MRLQPLALQQLPVGEGIAGVGVDRADGGLGGGQVVGVGGEQPGPVALRGLGHHAVGALLADDPADVAAQLVGHGQLTVLIPEEGDVGDADHLGRRRLLGPPDLAHALAPDGAVRTARLAVGHDAVAHLDPASVQRAVVAAQPKSQSSGWATTIRTRSMPSVSGRLSSMTGMVRGRAAGAVSLGLTA